MLDFLAIRDTLVCQYLLDKICRQIVYDFSVKQTTWSLQFPILHNTWKLYERLRNCLLFPSFFILVPLSIFIHPYPKLYLRLLAPPQGEMYCLNLIKFIYATKRCLKLSLKTQYKVITRQESCIHAKTKDAGRAQGNWKSIDDNFRCLFKYIDYYSQYVSIVNIVL